ncbi:ephrin type-B receptor 3-like [Elysia marginata]|uniref:Ephrin type-B receptor 3-like n=1 Tax=Elysia marginata TaxID=1093978 RepID=A0AAV4G831_9GAST|nr:ephrin type-B receptor 3-like [Elysia marginata]
MRQCSRMVDAANLVQCKETFNLYYFPAEGDFANERLPSWDEMTYTKVDTIAAESTFQGKDDVMFNTETQHIALAENGPRGVYFAIQDQGACLTIARVVIYYVTCPNITVNYAFFEETPTAARTTSIVEPSGRCVDHAVEKSKLSYVCQNDGQWYKSPRGECVCQPGYQGNSEETECIEGYRALPSAQQEFPDRSDGADRSACPAGQYKWSEGQGPCRSCPDFSHSTKAAAECTCDQGYLRSPRDDKSEPCTSEYTSHPFTQLDHNNTEILLRMI